MTSIPANFARTTMELFGAEGAAWLGRLPALIAGCERRWSLRIEPPFEPLSYNYVAPAVRADGSAAVFKAGVPHQNLLHEIAMLRTCAGQGIVEPLEADTDLGVFLLERLRPGTPLSQLENDEQATLIAAEVMRTLWRPPPKEHDFLPVERWISGLEKLRMEFDGATGPLPADLIDEAEDLFAGLLVSSGEPVLLHGDLHHDNILAARRAPWLAIDPKGVVGEPAYEVGALLRNPLPKLLAAPDPGRLMARRVDLLSDALEIDRARIRGWGLAQAVLSAWWSFEDHGYGWEPAIACARLLAAVKA